MAVRANISFSLEGKFGVWRCGEFSFMAMSGRFDSSRGIARTYLSSLGTEVSIKNGSENGERYIYGLCFQPLFVVYGFQFRNHLLAAESLDSEATKENFEKISSALRFSPDAVPDNYLRNMLVHSSAIKKEVEGYLFAVKVASDRELPVENVYFAQRYAFFLNEIKGMPIEESFARAYAKFNLHFDPEGESMW